MLPANKIPLPQIIFMLFPLPHCLTHGLTPGHFLPPSHFQGTSETFISSQNTQILQKSDSYTGSHRHGHCSKTEMAEPWPSPKPSSWEAEWVCAESAAPGRPGVKGATGIPKGVSHRAEQPLLSCLETELLRDHCNTGLGQSAQGKAKWNTS